MQRFKLITFDVTNTILRFKDVGQVYSNAARLFGIDMKPSAIKSVFYRVWESQESHYPNFGAYHGMTTREWWSGVVHECFRSNGTAAEPKLHHLSEYLYEQYNHKSCWDILPNSRQTLLHLKTSHPRISLGVVSNFDERLENIFDELDLSQYFDFVVISSKVKYYKPDPQIFRSALAEVGALPSEAVHVGDNVVKDYLGARSAGLSALLFAEDVSTADKRVNADHILTDIRDIEDKMSNLIII